ncbi:MAG: hypothetical protein CO183_00480 [Candidatus Zambryskibacteria bacterium CG_4_9_14_3_um_filter_42_9]|uniref:Uncharacterized protein n=1 Tax=Candidatus Zambryskibacteria bacterium CG22_combo_CG10-13_8_21_14_all_42_17 TaxID=1975118 RepID=A0A2H0BD20_9BACT|nr:MAG: hypothetical protein COX06_02895 [Candidatus Zambryskibacteria bacterium CG22_combo_CG10-13_8_21_14_all_42_17]PJA37004.1 MAG: hypothetical protein CO183_00480 [Candidatus Zambryskibacteria bacterium CG_4_9_14_3_um_filter_42_9]
MTSELEKGFAPLLVIAIIAILAIGGGVYYAKNQSENKTVETETEMETGASMEIELGVNTRGSLRSLVSLGRNVMCTFTSSADGYESEGTVYISADNSMRGDFTSNFTAQGSVESHMIMNADNSYFWSGNQGTKMSTNKLNKDTGVSTDSNQSVDLDSDVDYKCSEWSRDNSKFSVPSTVTFIDIDAMINGQIPGGLR